MTSPTETRPPIVVAGFGRCGSSMVMQMLAAGGVPCAGRAPAYEDDATKGTVTLGVLRRFRGRAVKVLDPHRVGLPGGDVPVIWLDRNAEQQARSIVKFLRTFAGMPVPGNAWRQLARQLAADQAAANRVLRGHPLLRLHFEQVLYRPALAARQIADFIQWPGFDPEAAASVVVSRPPRCAPDLSMEVLLTDVAVRQEAAQSAGR